MTTIRKFCCNDLLGFTSVNLDHLTITVSVNAPSSAITSSSSSSSSSSSRVAGKDDPLPDLVSYVARLLSCRRSSREPNHGLHGLHLTNLYIYEVLGATEVQARGAPWQGIVLAVNVASRYRRQNLATTLMQTFDKQMVEKMLVSPWFHRYYMCLYVGVSNTPAIEMFEQLGYEIIRVLPNFMPDKENANEMKKELVEE